MQSIWRWTIRGSEKSTDFPKVKNPVGSRVRLKMKFWVSKFLRGLPKNKEKIYLLFFKTIKFMVSCNYQMDHSKPFCKSKIHYGILFFLYLETLFSVRCFTLINHPKIILLIPINCSQLCFTKKQKNPIKERKQKNSVIT